MRTATGRAVIHEPRFQDGKQQRSTTVKGQPFFGCADGQGLFGLQSQMVRCCDIVEWRLLVLGQRRRRRMCGSLRIRSSCGRRMIKQPPLMAQYGEIRVNRLLNGCLRLLVVLLLLSFCVIVVERSRARCVVHVAQLHTTRRFPQYPRVVVGGERERRRQ